MDKKNNYIKPIDGLRAIAVLSIIVYHINSEVLSGGYLGVDIFFVISGFLITRIIFEDLKKKKFSFMNFYERRMRRILPALAVLIILTIPLSWVILSPENIIFYSKQIVFSIIFISNIFFFYQRQSYDATYYKEIPLLHTWSLGVEEQFYILFPFFFFILFSYFPRVIFKTLALVLFISFFYSFLSAYKNNILNFYLLTTRIWQLLSGSLLYYFFSKNLINRKSNLFNEMICIVGVFLIFIPFFFFNDKMLHPSYYTIIPILGACIIIYFSKTKTFVDKILSIKILIGIGLISYSLYLWHYPIIVFNNIYQFTGSNIVLILIIFLIAFLSYFFVEKPFRDLNNSFIKIATYLLIFFFIIFGFVILVIFNNGFPERYKKANLIINYEDKPFNRLTNPFDGKACILSKQDCYFQTNNTIKENVYLIGDSQMGSIAPDLIKKIQEKNFSVYLYIKAGCFFFPNVNKITNNKIDTLCNNFYFHKIKERISSKENKIIVFFSSNEYFKKNSKLIWHNQINNKSISNEDLRNIFFNEVELLAKSKNNKIIIVYPIPDYQFNIKEKLLLNIKKGNSLENITVEYEDYKNSFEDYIEILNKIEGPNIFKIRPNEVFCDTFLPNKCVANYYNKIFYYDSHHPSADGAEVINAQIIKKIELLNYHQ